jgi:predicted secreted protein with PEFG-CTERM motif
MLKSIFFILLSLTIMMPVAFAQEEMRSNQKIVLIADNTAYQEGDVITITGSVEKVIPGMPISLQVFFEKNLIQVSQVRVSQDGEFTDTFTAAGPQWLNEGDVIIRANYGGDTSTELIISFFKDTSGEYLSTFEVKIPGAGTFDVPYTMKGGIVTNMELNQKDLSLEISILTESDGVLDINLSRESIDSLSNAGQDIEFIVSIYENDSDIPTQTDYIKTKADDTHRAISVPIKDGDEKIVIIGTHVVPEFGTIAMIVLAVAIVSIIAVSAKSRLSIMPRI